LTLAGGRHECSARLGMTREGATQLDDAGFEPARLGVAFSAGRDSTALLHATATAAREMGRLEVVALHVHHGLSPHADAWLAHAEALCRDWSAQGLPVRLLSRRVQLAVTPGESIEAQARAARYDALTHMAVEAGVEMVLIAHHRRDQAETFLLQAMRGAGVAGLAAMPRDAWRGGVRWVRPWLDHPRESIEAYVAHHGLKFVDDDSNLDSSLARNRLRLEVWPALTAAFPQAEQVLAQSARRVSDVLPGVQGWRAHLLDGLYVEEAHASAGLGALALDAARWSALPPGERRESLAHWYRVQTGRSMAASWVERMAVEVPVMLASGRASCWRPIGVSLYRGCLRIEADLKGRASAAILTECDPTSGDPHGRVGAVATLNQQQVTLFITKPGVSEVPAWGGRLVVSEAAVGQSQASHGVSPKLLCEVSLRPRNGGERFQLGPERPARSLKKQFQALGVPAWRREGPLIFAAEKLLFVPGLGLDARVWVAPDTPGWALEWVADRASCTP
jgi:tRNA(Ile)-lysidine synthase